MSDKTDPITISSTPKKIQIIEQPPSKMFVRDIVIIKVSCSGSTLKAINSVPIGLSIFPV
jgi:hypothetical protein